MRNTPLLINDHDRMYSAFTCVLAAYQGLCDAKGVRVDMTDSLFCLSGPSLLKIPFHLLSMRFMEYNGPNTKLQEIGKIMGERFKPSGSLEDAVDSRSNRRFIDRLTEASAVGLNYQVIAFCAYSLGYMAGRLTDS